MRATVFVAALLTLAAALPAQESTRARGARLGADTLYRDPTSARVLGAILPGAGHVYAGEYLQGIKYYEGTVSIIALGSLVYVLDDCAFSFMSDTPCHPGPAWPHQVLGGSIIACGVGFWVYTVVDAGHAAERANERHPRRKAALSPFIAPRAGSGGANVGLSVAW